MKKILAPVLGLFVTTSVLFAQGYVNWSVTPGASVIVQTNTAISPLFGGTGTGGTSGNTVAGSTYLFYYTLLVNQTGTATTTPTALNDLSGWTATGLYMTNGTVANGRLSPAPASGGQVPYGGSGNENFMLVGWSVNLGSDWSTAYANVSNWETAMSGVTGTAFFGLSTVATLAPSTSSLSPSPIFGTGLIYNPIASPMYLYALPVPEPSTIALAGLGGLALLALRRRK